LNRYFWIAITLASSVAIVLGAVFFGPALNIKFNDFVEQGLNLLAAVLGVAATVAGLAGRREQVSQPDPGPAEDVLWSPGLRADPRDVLAEAQSLDDYIGQFRGRLQLLGADQNRFVALRTATDVAQHEIRPRLAWYERRADETFLQARSLPIDLFEISQRFDRVVLLGEPGSGKSTCLQQIALSQLDAIEADKTDQTLRLPVYVSLSDWSQTSMNAQDFLRSRLVTLLGPTNYYAHNFEALLAQGRFLFLLDGLNELPGRRSGAGEGRHEQGAPAHVTPDLRSLKAVHVDSRERGLRELAASMGLRSRFVMSCRSHEYFDSLQWTAIRVLPMDDEQIGQFIDAYLPPADATALRATVRENQTLRAIATNPFFLHSVISVYRPGIQLESRGDVLSHLLDSLLTREAQRGRETPSEAKLIATVGSIACRMLFRGRIGNQAALPALSARERTCVAAMADMGLMTLRDHRYFFQHQILQEFLAAAALHQRAVRRSPKTLLADKRFSEVVALWCDLARPRMYGRVIRALRARNLPWRTPRSGPSAGLSVFQTLSTLIVFAIGATYLLDWMTSPVHALTSPIGYLPMELWMLAVALLVIRVGWKMLVYHQNVITNAAFVLGQTRAPGALIVMVGALGRVWHTNRQSIAQSIAQFGSAATPHAIEGLGSKNWRVRIGCVQALGEIVRRHPEDSRATAVLIGLADTVDPQLARPLGEALVWCRDPRVPQAIAGVLNLAGQGSPMAVAFRLEALGRSRPAEDVGRWDRQVVGRFEKLLREHENPVVQSQAARLIGAFAMPGCEILLGEVARDTQLPDLVRESALAGLGLAQTDAAIEQLVAIGEGNRLTLPSVASTLRKAGDLATPTGLAAAATSSRWELREAAAIAIGRAGGEGALELLIPLAADNDYDVRRAAASGLGMLNRADAVPTLRELLHDAQDDVRKEARAVICGRYPDLAPGAMIELTVDEDYPDRVAAIQQLGGFMRSDVRAVLDRLSADASRAVREAARDVTQRAEERAAAAKGFSWKHPLSSSRAGVARWLRWDGLRDMWQQERLGGTPSADILSRVQSRIGSDAELTRQYRRAVNVFVGLMAFVGLVLATIVLVLLRLSLWGASTMLRHWIIAGAVIAVAAVSWLPRVERLREARFVGLAVGLIRWTAGFGLFVAIVAAFSWTWWIWILLVALAGTAYLLLVMRRRRSVRKWVLAAARDAAKTQPMVLEQSS